MTFIAAGASIATSMGFAALAGGGMATLGGTLAAGAITAGLAGATGAGIGALGAAATGGDIGKGALMGGVTGAVGGGALAGLSGVGAGTVVAGGLAGAAGGAAGSAAGGEDVGKGALVGGVLGAAGGALEGVGNAAAEDAAVTKGIAQQANAADTQLVGASNRAIGAASNLERGIASGVPTGAQLSNNALAQEALSNAARVASSYPTTGAQMAASGVGSASKLATPAVESASFLPKIITDNPKTSLGALGLGGAYLMSQKDQGLMADQAPTASIYAPIPYTQQDIPRTTVPKYYQYADGGIVPPQAQQQPTQPQQPVPTMNKFAQMGVQNAQQTIQQAQAQQPQQAQPQAGIPVAPTQMQPQQQFADGGLTEGMAGSGLLKSVYGAGIGKSVAPGVGNTLFGGADKSHDAFLQQVNNSAQQLTAQQLASQRAPGSQTPQTVAPVQPVAPVAVQRAAAGGIMKDNLGGYSHGGIAGLTRGPGDGVSDSIPAQIGESGKQPARLADGEFVIPARIVSELGNGSTEAGAKALQAMVDRVQARRSKTVGKGKVAVNSKARKGLPA